MVPNTLDSGEQTGQLFQLVAQQWESLESSITGQPPSGYGVKQESNKVANGVFGAVRSNLLPSF